MSSSGGALIDINNNEQSTTTPPTWSSEAQYYSASVYNTTSKSSNNNNNLGNDDDEEYNNYYQDEDDKPIFEHQVNKCNDPIFALLFIANVCSIIYTAIKYVPLMESSLLDEYNGNNNNDRRLADNSYDYYKNFEVSLTDVLTLVGVTGGVGMFLNLLALIVIMYCSKQIIYFCLSFNVIVTMFVIAVSIVMYVPTLAIIGVVFFLFSVYYAWVVWARIPFTAANLRVACTAVQSNGFGLSFYAYMSLVIIFGWTIVWSLSAISSMYAYMGCQGKQCQYDPSPWLVLLFLFSFYWTHQVVKNHLHTTVAGVVGAFWFTPISATSHCSPAVRSAFNRSSTYSFGSICLGSLLVAIVSTLKDFFEIIRSHDDNVLLCCAQCLLGCIGMLIDYFNQWAFVFVGLYGYNFLNAGKNVVQLFKYRGWSTIITDSLVDSTLTMMSICIGLITAVISSFIATHNQMEVGNWIAPWVIGFINGFVLASTLMSLLASAVNTVIVCYADGPKEFKHNHPQLSDIMDQSWRLAWPDEYK